jgi:type II secretory pathway component PulF
MAVFRYKLLTSSGKVEQDMVHLPFDNSAAAIRYLERQGGTVLRIKQLQEYLGKAYLALKKFSSGMKRQDLASFFNNLAMMQSAGVPVLSALKEIQADIDNKNMQGLINFICTDIEMGQTFSEALQKHPNIFSNLILNMIQIGEETGQLDQMQQKVADHIQHVDKIISDTKRALRYPSFLFMVVLGAVIFWFWYVVPKIVNLFQDMDMALPLITRILIYVSDFLQDYLHWGLLAAVTCIITILLLRKFIYKVRYTIDYLLLKAPIMSDILNTSYIARISENIGVLVGAGITVLRSLDIIISSLNNVVYKERIQNVRNHVQTGNTISWSMRQSQAMHPFAIRMIAVGEESGRLNEQTEYVARIYRQRLDNMVETLSKTLEPVLLITLGVFFAIIIAGLLLPVYDLISQIGMQ